MGSFSLPHLVFPHPLTHKKAHLLSVKALTVYLVLFVFLQYTVSSLTITKPEILGISQSITIENIIDQTNKKREAAGLKALTEEPKLNQAAALKAQNMFAENYWAHFSPSGKDPWGFMAQSGYKFSYAGENLAKNFQSPEDVVIAWMNSPSHRDNLLNSNYTDIGIAVANGNLQGQETTLVVQMFGKPSQPLLARPADQSNPTTALEQVEAIPAESQSIPVGQVASKQINQAPLPDLSISNSTIDNFYLVRTFGVAILGFIGFLLVIDLITLKRRGVLRLTSYHPAHLMMLGISMTTLMAVGVGQITDLAVKIGP